MSAGARAASLAGLDPAAVGADNLRRAVRQARERLGLSEQAYLARLAADPAERRALAGAAVVQETWLFRNPPVFRALGRLSGSLARPVRVLSAPCATGEEAASIAATLLAAGLQPEDFLVDAADANPQALAKARLGRFGPASLRGALPDCPGLRPDGGDMVLAPEALGRIRFLEADILDEGFLAGNPPYHAVFCNNLLIYLSAKARVRLAGNLARLLAPGGALFTSPAEAPVMAGLGLRPHDLSEGRDDSPPHHDGLRPAGVPAWTLPEQTGSRDPARRESVSSWPGAQRPTGGLDGPPPAGEATPGAALPRLEGPVAEHPAREPSRSQPAGAARPGTGLPDEPVQPGAAPAGTGEPDATRPQSAPLLSRARELADAGKLPEALELVDSALAEGEQHALAYHLKGVIHLAQGGRDAAEHAFRRALYLDPGHVESLGHLELLARADGRQTEAGLLAGRARRADSAAPAGEERS